MKEIKTDLTIFHPYDPFGEKTGGIESFLNGVIRYAPDDINVRFIGVSANIQKSPPGKWRRVTLGLKQFDFLPVLFVKSENIKTFVPLSLKYTLALNSYRAALSKGILLFNRIEPSILFRKSKPLKIIIIHSDIEQQISSKGGEVLWSKFPTFYYMFEKFLFRSIDYVFTVSEKTLRFYREKYSQLNLQISFIPTFVDSTRFHPSNEHKTLAKERMEFPGKTKISTTDRWILSVGRLQPDKAPIRLIDAFFQYFQKDPSSCLMIAGEGNEKSNMQKHTAILGLRNHVHFLGALSPEILADLYRASDVFILTSNYEGMPMSVLEALGSGLPVVSTDTGEIKRVVKGGYSGEISISFQPIDIAHCLEKILSNPDKYKKENCTECVVDYQPEKVLDPLYKLIRQRNIVH